MDPRFGRRAPRNHDLGWLLTNFVDRVPGTTHAAVSSQDGLLLATSGGLPWDQADRLASICGGIASLSGTASAFAGGTRAPQTLLMMSEGVLVVTNIGWWGLLAVLATERAPLADVGHQVAMLVDRLVETMARPIPAAG